MESQRKNLVQMLLLEAALVGSVYIYLEYKSGESTAIPNMWLRASRICSGIAESWGILAIQAEHQYYTALDKIRLS